MSLQQGRLITRHRERLACAECRRRKLKCDRCTPCATCVRRGKATSCDYEQARDRDRGSVAEARLQHLEDLVQQLVAQQSHSSSDAQNETSRNESSKSAQDSLSGLGSDGSTGLTYTGSTHWSAMLEDIQELRMAITKNEEMGDGSEETLESDGLGIGLLFGTRAAVSLTDVLRTHLPSRQEADRLTSAYFRARAVTAPFIHGPQFRRLYLDFWADPTHTSPLWVSMLFSVCHIARNTLKLGPDDDNGDGRHSVAAAHCLAIGEYFRPKRFSVEALLLYAQSQCLTSQNMPPDIGAVFGLLIRLATTMGYHRDPSRLPLSPFEQEMRRRTWSLCMQLDLLISFHLGLPSGIQFPTWDTQAPRNLLDSDLDEATPELPASRPESEVTEIMFYIAKHRFMVVFEKILRHTLATTADTADAGDVDELDEQVRRVFAGLPENLRPRPMSDSVVDSSSVVVTRLCVSFLYHKCLCVLHRSYVTRRREKSILACYEAASGIVGDFTDAYREFLPGCQAETERWFLSSITWHDFLLGTMALCLLLWADGDDVRAQLFNKAETLALLRRAGTIINEQASARTSETRRVQTLTLSTLGRFGDAADGPSARTPAPMNGITQDAFGQRPETENGWDWDAPSGMNEDESWKYLEAYMSLAD